MALENNPVPFIVLIK